MARESLMLAPATTATRRLSNGEQQIFEEAKFNIKILEQFGNKNIFNDANSYRDIYIINRRFENYVDIGYLHTNTKCVLIFGFLAISRYLCSRMTDPYCFKMSRALL